MSDFDLDPDITHPKDKKIMFILSEKSRSRRLI